jgi:hypothetical protein
MLLYVDQDIVVTSHIGDHRSWRVDYFQSQQKGPITRAEFISDALKLANVKARELGWIA